MSLQTIKTTSPLQKNITEIQKASERAASLTGQLLAFSRKQVLQPRVL
jgi:two-component system cell cycle sensor histidine kinase/response regulator CckA